VGRGGQGVRVRAGEGPRSLIPSAPVTAPPRRTLPGEPLLFIILLVLHLALLWAFPLIPTQDGPGHQAVAFILRQYDRPEAGLLRQYYLPNGEALPNWFIFFLMSRVLSFVSVPMAEKILLTAYVRKKMNQFGSASPFGR